MPRCRGGASGATHTLGNERAAVPCRGCQAIHPAQPPHNPPRSASDSATMATGTLIPSRWHVVQPTLQRLRNCFSTRALLLMSLLSSAPDQRRLRPRHRAAAQCRASARCQAAAVHRAPACTGCGCENRAQNHRKTDTVGCSVNPPHDLIEENFDIFLNIDGGAVRCHSPSRLARQDHEGKLTAC